MATAMMLDFKTALMILSYLGMSHERVVVMGWPGSYEFHCWSFFDVKLSYDPHSGYYLKSYPSDPMGNMTALLKMITEWSNEKYRKEYLVVRGVPILQPRGILSWRERELYEYEWYKSHTDKFGKWLK